MLGACGADADGLGDASSRAADDRGPRSEARRARGLRRHLAQYLVRTDFFRHGAGAKMRERDQVRVELVGRKIDEARFQRYRDLRNGATLDALRQLKSLDMIANKRRKQTAELVVAPAKKSKKAAPAAEVAT